MKCRIICIMWTYIFCGVISTVFATHYNCHLWHLYWLWHFGILLGWFQYCMALSLMALMLYQYCICICTVMYFDSMPTNLYRTRIRPYSDSMPILYDFPYMSIELFCTVSVVFWINLLCCYLWCCCTTNHFSTVVSHITTGVLYNNVVRYIMLYNI